MVRILWLMLALVISCSSVSAQSVLGEPPSSCENCQSHIDTIVDTLADLFLEEYILTERLIPLQADLESFQRLEALAQNQINIILGRQPLSPEDVELILSWMQMQNVFRNQIETIQEQIDEINTRLGQIESAARGLRAALRELRAWFTEHCTPVPNPNPTPTPDPNF